MTFLNNRAMFAYAESFTGKGMSAWTMNSVINTEQVAAVVDRHSLTAIR